MGHLGRSGLAELSFMHTTVHARSGSVPRCSQTTLRCRNALIDAHVLRLVLPLMPLRKIESHKEDEEDLLLTCQLLAAKVRRVGG